MLRRCRCTDDVSDKPSDSRAMTSRRLSNDTVQALPASAAVPAYDRAAITPGIVHLGVGAFHRAHQAAYVDDCLAAGETGLGHCRRLAAQRRHARRAGAAGRALHAGGARRRRREPARHRLDPVGAGGAGRPRRGAGRADRSAHPHRHPDHHRKGLSAGAGGGLDAAHPDIVHDLAQPADAEDRAWLPGRGAGAPPRRRHAALHRAVLRQPAGQRRDAAPAAGRVRRIARVACILQPAISPTRWPSRRAWSTASCRRPPMPTGRGSPASSASRTPGR